MKRPLVPAVFCFLIGSGLAMAGQVIDTLGIPTNGSAVTSVILEAGVTYQIRASGTFSIGGPGDGLGDAEYADLSALPGSAIDKCEDGTGVDLGIAIDDLVNDNSKSPFWGPPSDDSVYTIEYVGTGDSLSFNYHDCNYADNFGALTVEILGPAPLTLQLDGTCPGAFTGTVTGATPGGSVAVGFSPNIGPLVIPPALPCAGTSIDLGTGARLVGVFAADASGTLQVPGNAQANVCGGLIQVVDLGTCDVSNLEQLQ